MVLTKKPSIRLDVQIPAQPKTIKHSPKVKILGLEIEQALNWKYICLDSPMSIAKQLKKIVNSLKLLSRAATTPQLKMFANGIIMSKIEYRAEIWAAFPDYILKSLQSIQLEVARTVLGPKTRRWSTTHLLTELKWLSIRQIATLASVKLSHKILHSSQPETLAHRILSQINHGRITRGIGPFQLGPRPAGLGRTLLTKYQFRANAYKN